MKDGHKILLFSILAGTLTWILDAVIDSLAFAKGSFWSALTVSDFHENYMRALFMVNFILFGVLVSRFVERRRRLEQAQVEAERAFHDSEGRLQSVMESIADSIYMVDHEYRYLYMNRKHVNRLGLAAVGYRGRAYGDLHSFEETEDLIDCVDTVFETGDTVRREHYSQRDGRYFLRAFSPVRNGEGKVVAVTVVSKDVNDLKRMEEKLRALSLTDELTGLYNRRGFFVMAEQLLKLADRSGDPVFLLYCDLDNLKEINDELGHQDGDQAIRDTAQVLKETFRETDIAARIGGDEFVIVPIAGSKEDAENVIARVKEQVATRNAKHTRPYSLSMSMGLSWYEPGDGCSMEDLLKSAEKRMYDEKVGKKRRA